MNKTVSATIGGIMFHVEEDAYRALDAYLRRLASHFSTYPNNAEILADIENRIAEICMQRADDESHILTHTDVERAIATMGDPEQFDDAYEDTPHVPPSAEHSPASTGPKRLFRNPDDRIICGVCSGIAAYFGTSAATIRILVLLFFVFGLFSAAIPSLFIFLIYIGMCFVIPEAKTASEKMAMHGTPITVATLTERLNDEAKEIAERNNGWVKRATDATGRVTSRGIFVIKKIFGSGVNALRMIFGTLLAIASTAVLTGLLFMLAIFTFNIHSPFIDTEIRTLATGPLYYAFILATFLIFAIPAFGFLLGGIGIARHKNTLSTTSASILAAVWVLAGIVTTVIAIDRAPFVQAAIERQQRPEQAVTVPFEATPASRIVANGDVVLSITPSSTMSVVATGDAQDIQRVRITSSHDTLTVTSLPDQRWCLFCRHHRVNISITTPIPLTSIRLGGLVRASVEQTPSNTLEIQLNNASRLALIGTAARLSLTADDIASLEGGAFSTEHADINLLNAARADLHLETTPSSTSRVNVDLKDMSRLSLDGTADILEARLHDAARLVAAGLEATTSTLEMKDLSRADIKVTETVRAKLHDASRLRYAGTPATIDIVEDDAARGEAY